MERGGKTLFAKRGRFWALLALGLFTLLACRLFVIQVIQHGYFCQRADETQGRKWPIRAPRGNIYDRNGNPLALNLKLYTIAADPMHLTKYSQPAAVSSQLAPLLRISPEELTAKLSAEINKRFVLLRNTVDEPVAQAVRKMEHNLPGLIVNTEWKRVYPHETLAAGLLGFVGRDLQGLGGIEGALNERLAGTDGQMLVVLDGRLPRSRNQIPGLTVVNKNMTPGGSVVLAIDLEIQAIAEEELRKAVEATHAAGGTAIVMDPENGEVLALATQPDFDPNDIRSSDPNNLVSRAVASPYEPGSTFKIITACAAIEEGVMSHGEAYHCTGTRAVGNRIIGCALHGGSRAHGIVDLNHMVIESCNIGMGTVALGLGAERLYRWVRKLGFGERTGIELAGESPGQVPPHGDWPQVQVANVGFGQGISVTAIQLLTAYCTVANGGWRVYPRVVKALTGVDGRLQPTPSLERKQILSPATSERMRAVLEKVVEEGTGTRAQIPGRRVAGKTGTAQKPTPQAGYRSGKFIGSFVGFAPVEHPRLAILVAIDEPKGSYYGGVVAAPAFRAICERSLAYLRVPPDTLIPEKRQVVASRAGGF